MREKCTSALWVRFSLKVLVGRGIEQWVDTFFLSFLICFCFPSFITPMIIWQQEFISVSLHIYKGEIRRIKGQLVHSFDLVNVLETS